MTNWSVGMKLVCVDDRPSEHSCFGDIKVAIKRGHIYTIRGFDIPRGGTRGVYLVGIYNRRRREVTGYGPEIAWHHRRFRPLLGDEQESLDAIEEEVKETELIPLEA